MATVTLEAALLLVFVVRDQHSYDRVHAEQDTAAGRVLSAFKAGATPSASDLARIGTDLPAAEADVALIRTVHVIDDIDTPPRLDENIGGRRH